MQTASWGFAESWRWAVDRVENPQLVQNIMSTLESVYIDSSRKSSIHMTDLIYCLTKSYFDKTDPLPPTPQEVLLFSVGVGLQRILIPPDRDAETVVVGGVVCSPDFISVAGVMAELKTTRMSSVEKNKESGVRQAKEFPATWVEQMMGYCYASVVAESGLYEYDMAVLHLMGNYAPPFPELKGWRCSFSTAEVESYWKYLMGRKEVLVQAVELKVRPRSFQWCKEWECENCRYKMRCEVLSRE